MGKTEVYSWRLSPQTKMALEEKARAQGKNLSELLDVMADELLNRRRQGEDDEREQQRLHVAARKAMGKISGGGSRRSENVSDEVRRRLKARYAR